MKKLSAAAMLLICGLAISGRAQTAPDLNITADNMYYEGDQIVASGSVEAVYKDLYLRGQRLRYDPKTSQIFMDQNFQLNYTDTQLTGKLLDYNLLSRCGTAENIKVEYLDKIDFSGQDAVIRPDEVRLKNADFNACGLDRPHYSVAAREIVFYPKQGWMIAFWGLFSFYQMPTVPVPVYVFDIAAEQKGQKNSIPFPMIGSSVLDGDYISETLSWYKDRELYGTVSGAYSFKKGLGLGAEAHKVFNEQSRLGSGVFWYFSEPMAWWLAHRYAFGAKVEAAAPGAGFAPQTLFQQASRLFELETKAAFREHINNQYVSMLPRLKLSLNKTTFQKLDISASVFAGLITEEAIAGAIMTAGGNLQLSCPLAETLAGPMRLDLNGNYRYYRAIFAPLVSSQTWAYLNGHLYVKKEWSPGLTAHLGYTHYFYNTGDSVFAFERYKFVQEDQADFGFSLGRDKIRGSADAFYKLSDGSPIDLDYSLFAEIHCYEVGFTYRALRGEFLLGFNLL